MNTENDSGGQLLLEDRGKWLEAFELNCLLHEETTPEQIYWHTTQTHEWNKLQSVAQVPSILRLVEDWGDTFSIQNEEPATKYAQGAKLSDGKFTLELAVVSDKAYNIRIGYGPKADSLSSEPSEDVSPGGQQSLNTAQVSEVLGQWLLGKGLPAGYGGSLHIYG